MLSDVKHWKGKINSCPSPAKQQQGEIQWEGSHRPIYIPARAEMKACFRDHHEHLSGMHSLSDAQQGIFLYCALQSFSIWEGIEGTDAQNLAGSRKSTQWRLLHSLSQSQALESTWFQPFNMPLVNLNFHCLMFHCLRVDFCYEEKLRKSTELFY